MAKITIEGCRITPSSLRSGGGGNTNDFWDLFISKRRRVYFVNEFNQKRRAVDNNQLRVNSIGYATRYRPIKTVEYRYRTMPSQICYDYCDLFLPSSSAALDGIRFVDVVGRFLGVYIPDWNVLSMCDMTNTEDGAVELASFLEFLEEEGYIKAIGEGEGREVEVEPCISITIGSDPEYEPIHAGEIFYANKKTWERTAHVGVDDSGAQIEFRPRPASTPEGFVESLRECYAYVADKLEFNLSTVGNKFPLGAHIHIGAGSSAILTPNIRKAFDYFLGKLLLCCSGTARSRYKKLGEFRVKEHGFEYRSLPTAVLHTPDIAKAVAETSIAICNKLYDGKSIEVSTYGATIQDLVSIGVSEESARLLRNWRKEYPKVCHMSPLSFWLGREYEDTGQRVEPTIELRDQWHQSASEIFRSIRDTVGLSSSVLCFGLAERRGQVTYGYRVEGYSMCTDNFEGQDSRADIVFGVPHNIRMGRCTPQEIREHVDAISRIIKKREEE